ncbi:hypothetical protein [Sabulicella rubraurantiaca]|uniref:hypothetical protein n=1 Tax=Sabulicella rubraurantiaca TaxID=2811429 RepID=UPI001A96753E|nr:hypothetical protein [Sabulicella rubraurantiaca]
MIARLACLHTARSNAALFEAAVDALPVRAAELSHHARPDLLREPDAATLDEAARVMEALTRGADSVILTCSTIGRAVERVRAPCPVLRADAALAEAATRSGGEVTVLYAAPTTREPTEALFSAAAARTGATVKLHFVAKAWDCFLGGDLSGYHARIREAAEEAMGRVAFAQASMTPAAEGLTPRPLTVPGAAILAALRAIREAR